MPCLASFVCACPACLDRGNDHFLPFWLLASVYGGWWRLIGMGKGLASSSPFFPSPLLAVFFLRAGGWIGVFLGGKSCLCCAYLLLDFAGRMDGVG